MALTTDTHAMLAHSKLIERLTALPAAQRQGFVRLREATDVTSFLGWLKAQTLGPRLYWHARERDREFATLGCLRELTDAAALAALHRQPKPGAGSWPRYYGGLAFDPAAALAPHWHSFGHCRFVLPRIELIRLGNQIELVINLWFDNEPAQQEAELAAACAALQQVQPEARLLPPAVLHGTRTETPDASRWHALVTTLTTPDHLAVQPKVVLARESRFATTAAPNPFDLLAALQPVTPNCFHFAFEFEPGHCLIACSPERLYRRAERHLESEALAGTIVRSGDADRDDQLAAQLLADNKNRLENRLVHADILQRLEGLAARADLSAPRILRLRRLQHLRRDIDAELKADVSDADLLAALHPTPAVGGTPRRKALAFLREHESFSRGWYAGACGLISDDVAEFAVAIRCALLTPDAVRLYAGAGIVEGSEPAAEWQELDDKLATLLGVLQPGDA